MIWYALFSLAQVIVTLLILYFSFGSESCNQFTSINKSELYHQSKNVIPFKIDIRIVYNHEDTDSNLVNGEVACHDGDDKAVADEGKLTREGKEIQDLLIENKRSQLFAWTVQHTGEHF